MKLYFFKKELRTLPRTSTKLKVNLGTKSTTQELSYENWKVDVVDSLPRKNRREISVRLTKFGETRRKSSVAQRGIGIFPESPAIRLKKVRRGSFEFFFVVTFPVRVFFRTLHLNFVCPLMA